MGSRWSGWWVAVVTLVVLGPALGWGYVLSYDMVFVPRQSLLPAALGLGEVLPRAVPQDAIMSILTVIAPGLVWQHLALVGIVAGGIVGVGRLLRPLDAWQRWMGGLLYVWSAFVAERLVLGSWSLLVAYAVLPWVVSAALRVRAGAPHALPALVLLIGLGSLTPTGGVLVLLVSLPIAVGPRTLAGAPQRWATALVGLGLQLPWVVPAITASGSSGLGESGLSAFGLRSEGPWGALITALGTGGVWNAEAVPATRTAGLGVAGTAVVVALSVVGLMRHRTVPVLGRSGTWVLLGTAVGGIALAVVGSVWPQGLATMFGDVPGAGLLRDGQKWLAPLALLLAVAAPVGAGALVERLRDPITRRTVIVVLLVLPVVVLPDLAWGVSGHLRTVTYPADWARVRSLLTATSAPGDVVVLPWGAFRQFSWNARRTSLDPAPRWLPRTSVVDDSLLVRDRDGSLITVPGESARATAVGLAVATGTALLPTLQREGIGFVLVEGETPGEVTPAQLRGLTPAYAGANVVLLAVPTPAAAPQPPPWRIALVLMGWAVALAIVLGACLAATRTWFRRINRTRGHQGGNVPPRSGRSM